MKKLVLYGLVLATLTSFGSLSFAFGLDANEPDLVYSHWNKRNFTKLDWDKDEMPVYISDENCEFVYLENDDATFNMVNICDNFPFSLCGRSTPLEFIIDAKGKDISEFEVFINIGDGQWRYIMSNSLCRGFQDMHFLCAEKFQYKVNCIYKDGYAEAIKFMGADLIDLPMCGEIDFGPISFKVVRPRSFDLDSEETQIVYYDQTEANVPEVIDLCEPEVIEIDD